MIYLTLGKNEKGNLEYYLNGLDTYESFEQVLKTILDLNLVLIDRLDGIYSRTAKFCVNEKKFKIIFHEDVGVYAFSVSESKENDSEWLHEILISVVENLNKQ